MKSGVILIGASSNHPPPSRRLLSARVTPKGENRRLTSAEEKMLPPPRNPIRRKSRPDVRDASLYTAPSGHPRAPRGRQEIFTRKGGEKRTSATSQSRANAKSSSREEPRLTKSASSRMSASKPPLDLLGGKNSPSRLARTERQQAPVYQGCRSDARKT